MPGPLSPLFETTFVPEAEMVMQDLCRGLRLRLPRPFLAVIHGRLYLRGDSYLSAGLLLVPLAYLRFVRRLERRWRDEWLPELLGTTARWERPPGALSDTELLQGIDELARAGARYWRAAYLPRFAGASEHVFTRFHRAVARDGDPAVAELLTVAAHLAPGAQHRTAPHLDFVNAVQPASAGSDGGPRRRPGTAHVAAATTAARLGRARRAVFLRLWRWAHRWATLREESMLYMGHPWPVLRDLVAEWERRHQLPEGLAYFLRRDELARPPEHAASVAARRRELWLARRSEPAPLMLPAPFRILGFDMRAYLAGGRSAVDGGLRGVGVSPGTAIGRARVVFSPGEADGFEPGDILVAPLTNPAWTPLMAVASAIVTDTGGPLSHASIVAREFGIPAVVGTGDATCRIAAGSTITVDGSTGIVTAEQPPARP